MLLRGDPRLPLHSDQEELAGNGERPMPISVVLELGTPLTCASPFPNADDWIED